MLAKILSFLIKHPKATFFSSLSFALFLSLFAFKLNVDASAQSLLLENDKDLKIFRELRSHYKDDDFLMLAFKTSDDKPFSQENLNKLQNLHQDLEQVQNVARVFSVINAPLFLSNDKELKELLKNIPTILSQDINKSKAIKELLTSPFYKNNIVSKDAKYFAFIIYLKPDEKYFQLLKLRDEAKEDLKASYRLAIQKHQEEQKLIINKSLDELKMLALKYSENNQIYLSGVSVIIADMISYIKSDLITYGFALVFILGCALWYFFGSFYFVFLTLFICFITLGASSGIFALLNFQITVISSNYVALVLIITLSLNIHLLVHFLQKRKQYPRSRIQKILLQSLLAKAKPSFYAILTTMIGFFSLIFSKIEPIIKLGIMMSISLILALILSYLFLASALVLFEPKKIKIKDFHFDFLSFCAKLSLEKRKIIYFICSLCVILALYGISSLKVENSFVNYFKDTSDIKQGLLVIDKNLGGTLPLELVISFKEKTPNQNEQTDSFESEFENLALSDTYFFDSKKTRIATKVHQFLENKNYVGSVLSLASLLNLAKELNNGKELDDFSLAFLNENLPKEIKENLLSSFVNIEHKELRFLMRIVDSDPKLRRNEFLKELKNELDLLLKDENVKVQLTGIMLLYNNMLQSLFASQFDTLSFVILSIFILFIFVFKSIKFALIAILVNVIPLSLVFALMGIFNIPLDLMSITIAAIAIGIGVDDALHYIHRFKEELKTKDIASAIKGAHNSIGCALYYTTISVILGFSIMMSSNFIPTIYFGILTIFVMLTLLAGSLILLPSLLMSLGKPIFKSGINNISKNSQNKVS